MDFFLDEVNKKRVSDEIRQRKREEKLAKVESVSPEKDKQVSVDKRVLRKENQKKQREKFIQEVSEGVQKDRMIRYLQYLPKENRIQAPIVPILWTSQDRIFWMVD